MGRGGTDVARDAADLVLTDDNFASVVAGIEEGRAAYANIRKVIYLLVSTGAAEVVSSCWRSRAACPSRLRPCSSSGSTSSPTAGRTWRSPSRRGSRASSTAAPRRPDEPIFDRLMIRQTAVSGVAMGVVAFAVFAWMLGQGWSEFEARNVLLFLMVLFENVHVFNCRSETRSAFRIPLGANRPLLAAVLAAQSVQVGAAFVPGLRDVLEIEPIAVGTWLVLLPAAASLLAVVEIDKLVRRRRPDRDAGFTDDERGRRF